MSNTVIKNMWEFARSSKIVIGGASMLIVGALLGWGVFVAQPHEAEAAAPDCTDAAIIKCGVNSPSEFSGKYTKNKQGDLQKIFAEFGLSADEISRFEQTAKPGEVYKDGRLIVDGKTVATNVEVLSRTNSPGATKKTIGGKTYYLHKPTKDPYEAMVMFNDQGVVEAVVLKPCANPVTFTPKVPKQPEESIAQCVGLIATLQEGTRTTYDYETDIETEGNVKVIDYTFDFGDGSAPQTTKDSFTSYTYKEAGAWQTQVTVKFEVDGEVVTRTSEACTAATPVQPETPPEECKPGIPVGDARCEEQPEQEQPKEEAPAELPATGPASLLAGTVGISSLAGAGYYWKNSRRNLIERLFDRKK